MQASGLCVAASFLLGGLPHIHTRSGSILIKNGRLIDGRGRAPVERASILIEGGRFKEIGGGNTNPPPGAHVLDAEGRTVLPGLIDMHAHLLSGGFDTISEKSMSYDPIEQKRALKQMLYWGVTGVCDPVQPLAAGLSLQAQVAANSFLSPRLFISGPAFTAPGGWAGSNDPQARFEPKSLGEVRRQIDRLADARVNIIKLFYDDMRDAFTSPLPKLNKRLMEEIIVEAHARKLRVMVHVYDTLGHKDAMRAGADIMAHSAITAPIDDEYIELARKNRTLYLSTLSVYHDVFDEKEIRDFIAQDFVQKTVPKKTLDTLRSPEPLNSFEKSIKQDYIKNQLPVILNNLERVFEAGIPVGVGPDTGVPGAFPGIAVHREMELMVKAGVPAADVLVGATRTGAAYLGESSLGTIEVGKAADLTIVKGDPLKDIKNTRNIEVVIKAGTIIDREKLLRDILE